MYFRKPRGFCNEGSESGFESEPEGERCLQRQEQGTDENQTRDHLESIGLPKNKIKTKLTIKTKTKTT